MEKVLLLASSGVSVSLRALKLLMSLLFHLFSVVVLQNKLLWIHPSQRFYLWHEIIATELIKVTCTLLLNQRIFSKSLRARFNYTSSNLVSITGWNFHSASVSNAVLTFLFMSSSEWIKLPLTFIARWIWRKLVLKVKKFHSFIQYAFGCLFLKSVFLSHIWVVTVTLSLKCMPYRS